MKYILEVYYQGDIMEHRECSDPSIPPAVGEEFYIEFGNKSWGEMYGLWWVVRRRRIMLFNESMNAQTIMLDCEPVSKKGNNE